MEKLKGIAKERMIKDEGEVDVKGVERVKKEEA